MNAREAEKVIESLRKGIPPDGYVRSLTVGRKTEIRKLAQHLNAGQGSALLLNANYGAGKTHLLRFLREEALAQNYAVSTVALDCNSAVRFNRMDQIFGAICRNIELPGDSGSLGIRLLFDLFESSMKKWGADPFWKKISNGKKWDYSEVLDSPAMFVALRAWVLGTDETRDLIEDWFYQPWQYRTQRKRLYEGLITDLYKKFNDPRGDWEFYGNNVFMFNTEGHAQSWAALRDLDELSRIAGLNGMIILFDEFEDVITNLNNVAYQEAAFTNLFNFYAGELYGGKTFYAVTPAFVEKCKDRLLSKERWDFDLSQFDRLPKFEMSPLESADLQELAATITRIHGIAYRWNAEFETRRNGLHTVINNAAKLKIQDRTRQAIKAIVKHLDNLMQDA